MYSGNGAGKSQAKAKQMVLGGAFEAACPGITSLVEMTKSLRVFSLQPCVPVLHTFWKLTNNGDIFFIQHNIMLNTTKPLEKYKNE